LSIAVLKDNIAGSLPDPHVLRPHKSFAYATAVLPCCLLVMQTGLPQPPVVVFGHRDRPYKAQHILVSSPRSRDPLFQRTQVVFAVRQDVMALRQI